MRRLLALHETSVGTKILMALSGIVFFGFVLVHMIGNLKLFLGEESYNAYARFLREVGHPALPEGGMLWIFRVVLLAALGIHLWAAWTTWRRSVAARDVGYKMTDDLSFSYASRTMRWGGVVIGLFVVYHLMHFTWGNVHPSFDHENVYRNVVTGFRQWPASIVYIGAMIVLCLHLYHGVWSATQTLALDNPRWEPWRRPIAGAIAVAIAAANISMPLAVLAGLIK